MRDAFQEEAMVSEAEVCVADYDKAVKRAEDLQKDIRLWSPWANGQAELDSLVNALATLAPMMEGILRECKAHNHTVQKSALQNRAALGREKAEVLKPWKERGNLAMAKWAHDK